jgi:hypothetical protein
MASTTAFAGEKLEDKSESRAWKSRLYTSICGLSDWLERNDYRGYDTFDGVNASFVRPLTFENKPSTYCIATRCAALSPQCAPPIGNYEVPFQQGDGFPGPRIHASFRMYW